MDVRAASVCTYMQERRRVCMKVVTQVQNLEEHQDVCGVRLSCRNRTRWSDSSNRAGGLRLPQCDTPTALCISKTRWLHRLGNETELSPRTEPKPAASVQLLVTSLMNVRRSPDAFLDCVFLRLWDAVTVLDQSLGSAVENINQLETAFPAGVCPLHSGSWQVMSAVMSWRGSKALLQLTIIDCWWFLLIVGLFSSWLRWFLLEHLTLLQHMLWWVSMTTEELFTRSCSWLSFPKLSRREDEPRRNKFKLFFFSSSHEERKGGADGLKETKLNNLDPNVDLQVYMSGTSVEVVQLEVYLSRDLRTSSLNTKSSSICTSCSGCWGPTSVHPSLTRVARYDWQFPAQKPPFLILL